MVMIQVRNVPEDVHRALKIRAAQQGVTLSELALNELKRAASKPSVEELKERIAAMPTRDYQGETAAESTRAERDSH